MEQERERARVCVCVCVYYRTHLSHSRRVHGSADHDGGAAGATRVHGQKLRQAQTRAIAAATVAATLALVLALALFRCDGVILQQQLGRQWVLWVLWVSVGVRRLLEVRCTGQRLE